MVDIGDETIKWPGMAKSDSPENEPADPNQNKDLSPEEKQQKIDEGLRAIDKEENQYLTGGTISKEEAETVTTTVKKTHTIFTVLKVIDGEDSWDYYYEASQGKKKKGEAKEIPNRRYLPNDFKVRRWLYENGSGFGSMKKKVRKNGLDEILEKIRTAKNNSTLPLTKKRIWNQLIRDGQIPSDATISGYTLTEAANAEYDVDHIKPLARHWHESGYNSTDRARHDIAGGEDNLLLMLSSVNRSIGGEGYYYVDKFYVGKDFSSEYNNSPRGSLKIKRKSFLDENGKTLG